MKKLFVLPLLIAAALLLASAAPEVNAANFGVPAAGPDKNQAKKDLAKGGANMAIDKAAEKNNMDPKKTQMVKDGANIAIDKGMDDKKGKKGGPKGPKAPF